MGHRRQPTENGMPPCFDSIESYKDWVALARTTSVDHYCEDCTPERRDKMISEGRCNHPMTRFERDYSGAVIGRRAGDRAPYVLSKPSSLEVDRYISTLIKHDVLKLSGERSIEIGGKTLRKRIYRIDWIAMLRTSSKRTERQKLTPRAE